MATLAHSLLAVAAYPTMENFGRKKTLIGTAALFNVGCILQIAATHQIGLIYAGRVVVGIAVGFVTTCCPVYLAELSPPAIRGRLVGFCASANQSGSSAYALTACIQTKWRTRSWRSWPSGSRTGSSSTWTLVRPVRSPATPALSAAD